jgi:hypothetical protein
MGRAIWDFQEVSDASPDSNPHPPAPAIQCLQFITKITRDNERGALSKMKPGTDVMLQRSWPY